MKSILKKFYFKEMHNPSLFSIFFNPFYFARRGLYKNISQLANNVQGNTLDVGCGSKPYKSLYQFSIYSGLEIDTPENRELKDADYFYDGKTFPFENDMFDSVVMNQVFEHIFNPDQCLDEVSRVLKSGGILLLTIPFAWDEHEQPFDYARYSSFGIRSILEKHGFYIIEQRKSVSDIRVIFQLLSLYVYKKLRSSNSLLNLLVILAFIAPINIIGILINIILPKNEDLYLDNIILAKKS